MFPSLYFVEISKALVFSLSPNTEKKDNKLNKSGVFTDTW